MELADCTGFSNADLCERFYAGLSGKVKESLVPIKIAHGHTPSLQVLVDCATNVDYYLQEHLAKEHPQQHWTPQTQSTPQPLSNPNAMEVDATQTSRPTSGNGKTQEDFCHVMARCCYGCRAQDHIKANGGHG